MNQKLNHRIEVHENQKHENELGEEYYSYELLQRLWASIIPQTGSLQKQQADTILTNVTHKIIVRYSVGKNIEKEHKIYYKGREYEIRYILNPYEANEYLELFVQEVLT